MKRTFLTTQLFLWLCLVLAVSSGARGETVQFRDRTIDLSAHLMGFPYRAFQLSYAAGIMLYQSDDGAGARTLRSLEFQPASTELIDVTRGTTLGTQDWTKRNLRDVQFDPASRRWVAISDDANEERFNLFSIDGSSGALKRLTDKPYLYGYGFDRRDGRVAVIARYPADKARFRSCLEVQTMLDGPFVEALCDTPERTFTWSDVSFRPDGRGVIVQTLEAFDRNRGNFVYIPIDPETGRSSGMKPLTDVHRTRHVLGAMREWIDNEWIAYLSDENGFTNAYALNVETLETRTLTHREEDATSLFPMYFRGQLYLVVVFRRPTGSELVVLDPPTGTELIKHTFDETLTELDHDRDRAMFVTTSRKSAFGMVEVVLYNDNTQQIALDVRVRAKVPDPIAAQIERCNVEAVQIPTFDLDAKNKRRMLHAFVQTPKNPPADPKQAFALVEAYYGGENEFDTRAQILCDAGAIVVSPAVRGSEGFGAAFASLNDHDLGGNEVFDLMAVSRWLRDRTSIPASRIGLHGGSHGGYEVMRALTMPAEVNGRRDHFRWGFGISLYGFSDIESFFRTCNIPDWVLLEAGDPNTEHDRLKDRSPLTHAARATGPLLLLHGSTDSRVPVEQSRTMADALKKAGRRVRFVEFEGQGHGLKGVANQTRMYKEIFSFLQDALDHPQRAPHQKHWSPRKKLVLGLSLALLGLLGAGAWIGTRSRSQD